MHGSGDHRRFVGELLPASGLDRLVDLEDCLYQLVLLGEEVRGNPDTSPHAVVDQDVAGQQVLGDFVAVGDVERDVLLYCAGRAGLYLEAASSPARLAVCDAKALFPDRRDPTRRRIFGPSAAAYRPE